VGSGDGSMGRQASARFQKRIPNSKGDLKWKLWAGCFSLIAHGFSFSQKEAELAIWIAENQ
jgi:hypothetical protein